MTAILASGCAQDCRNDIVTRVRSPDGAHEAVLFQRDCGATTGFSTQISVLRAGAQLSQNGNVFRADTNHDLTLRTGGWHGPWAELRWLSPSHLLIRYVAGARLFAREAEINAVAISYEPVASPARP